MLRDKNQRSYSTFTTFAESRLQLRQKSISRNREEPTVIEWTKTKAEPTSEQQEARRKLLKGTIETINIDCGLTPSPPRKKKKDPQLEALEKYFGVFAFLDFGTMKKIKEQLDRYDEEEKQGKHGLMLLRYLNRKDLIKIMLIALAEFRVKALQPINALETVLSSEGTDSFGLIRVIAQVIEDVLFTRLFKEDVKPREEPYQVQIKIIKTQAYDKTNFQFRRSILNKTATAEYLLKANEEELKSSERKQEEKDFLLTLVRESQSWTSPEYEKRIKEDNEDRATEYQSVQQEVYEVSDEGMKSVEIIEHPQQIAYRKSLATAFEAFQRCCQEMQARLKRLANPQGKRLRKNWSETVQQK